MRSARADFDPAVLLLDPGETWNPRDVDQNRRLAETQLHQRHEAVPAGDQLAAARCLQLRQRIVDRGGTLIVERRRDHATPPWPEPCRRPWPELCRGPLMMRHSFSGRNIMSMCFTPNSLNASTAAETTLGVEPSVPASPTPLAPRGFTGVGVTVAWSSKRGKSMARGSA